MTDPATIQIAHAQLRVFREQAVEAARRGGAELRRLFGSAVETGYKTSGRDLVTAADHASEREILTFIEERNPDHGWQSEEAGSREGAGGWRWVIDPLDGTANFAHGYPHFSVSVALIHHEMVVAGAVYDPLRDESFEAARGQGACLNGVPIAVSTIDSLDRALVSTGFPYEPPEHRRAMADLAARAVERVQMLRRTGSAALDLSYVAAGRAEAHWEFYLSLHDVAAGLLLVHEAGGLASVLSRPGWPPGYLASNGPAIEREVYGLLEEHLGDATWERVRFLSSIDEGRPRR
jgi:myo-inositol-1(or 4)-monophosphatase